MQLLLQSQVLYYNFRKNRSISITIAATGLLCLAKPGINHPLMAISSEALCIIQPIISKTKFKRKLPVKARLL
jgi:hypothetical protein